MYNFHSSPSQGHDEFLATLRIHPFNLTEFDLLFGDAYKTNATEPSNSNLTAPDSVDWRKKGAVTPVKNQGQCGSCWAFSAVGAIESAHFIKNKKLVRLSEQNILDCVRSGSMGCQGGYMNSAFDYVVRNRGIAKEDSYRYMGRQGQCRYRPESRGATITGYKPIPRGNENALTDAIAKAGPVSIAMDVSDRQFQFYRGGIYSANSCSRYRTNHAMLAVGYGQGYYLIKNSWGAQWGNQGYVQVRKDGQDRCGLTTMAAYPTA